MSETGSSAEEIGGIKPKDSRELVGQLSQTYHSKEADEVVGQAGYDNEKVKQRLQEFNDNNTDGYKFFVDSLRRSLRENEEQVSKAFNGFLSANPENAETQAKRGELEARVVRKGEVSPETAQEIKELFPSGN